MREAAIDIGTNTMLILIADVDQAVTSAGVRVIREVHDDRINFVRLGQGVNANRRFLPEAMERAMKTFREYRALCDQHHVDVIRAFATSASRDAANSGEFYARVKVETGIEVGVIGGEVEARLSFLGGLLSFQDPARSAVMDIGGGSTEFVVLGEDGKQVRGQSMDMGCVRATEMFLKGDPYERATIDAMTLHLKNVWKKIDPKIQSELREKEWTGIAGTPTTLAGITLGMTQFDAPRLDGYRMSLTEVTKLYAELASDTQANRAKNPLMGTGRADIIVAGAAILLTAMEYFGKESIVVSSRGLRHGILLSPPLKERV